jgi:predicted RNA-binding Zn ribbon-like protein
MAKKRKRSDVPRELRQSGGELCLAFANTAATRRDDRYRTPPPTAPVLASYGDLVTWGQRMGTVDGAGAETLRRAAAARPDEAAALFAHTLELRDAMLRIFTAEAFGKPPEAEDFELLKRALARAMPAREVAAGAAGYGWRHPTRCGSVSCWTGGSSHAVRPDIAWG